MDPSFECGLILGGFVTLFVTIIFAYVWARLVKSSDKD